MKKNKIKNIKKYKNGAEINFQDVNNGFQNPVFYQDPNRFKTIVPEPEARNFFMESLADLGKGALSIGSVVANVIPGYGQAISAGLSAINSAVGPTRSQQVAKKKGKGDFLTSLDDVGSKVSAGLQNMQGSKEGTSGNGIIGDVTKITDPEVQTQGDSWFKLPKNQYEAPKIKNGGMIQKYNNGAMVPIQAEQDENFILPNGEIMQSQADAMHEQMGANEITDMLPENSYGTSVRNKMSLKELSPYLDEKTLPMFQEIYKKIGKKSISPNDISEIGRKTQKEATPNSFKTEELNKASKDIYSQMAMHMNEIINAGKQVQQQMKNGGMVKKYAEGDYVPPMFNFLQNKINLNDRGYKVDWGNINTGFTPLLDNTYFNTNRRIAKPIGADMHSYDGRVSKEWANKVANFYSQIPGSTYHNPSMDLNPDMFGTIMNNEMLAQNADPNWLKEWDGPVVRNADNTFTFPNRRKSTSAYGPQNLPIGVRAQNLPGNIGQEENLSYDKSENLDGGKKKKRFNFGNDELLLGVQGLSNLYAKNSAMKQTPNHAMETPSTYISSMKTEMPIGSDLYNIEKSGKNTNQFLRDNTNSYSLLAGNAANNNATTTNKIGDYLTNINQQNVGLYNKQQELLQGLLGDNMKIQNQNATDQNDMANYKRMLDSEMWKQNVDKFGKYVENKNVKNQQQDNTEMSFIHLIGANPDLAKNPAVAEFLKNFLSKNKTILNK